MTIKISDFDSKIVHDGNKRRVAGDQKIEIDKMLETASAAKVHNKLVKKVMSPGDVEPAHIPTKNALRIRKHRNQMKGLDKDPYHSLSSMAEYEFKRSIHHIGFNPFSVIYSTPLQRKWYKTQSIDNRKVLSIDATGLKVIPPNGSRISDNSKVKWSIQTSNNFFVCDYVTWYCVRSCWCNAITRPHNAFYHVLAEFMGIQQQSS